MSKGDLPEELESIDWNVVPEREAKSCNLAVNFFKESYLTFQLRRTALGTALGGVLSMTVLAILAVVFGANPWFVLSLIIVHQALRTVVLAWRSYQARRQHVEIEQQAILTTRMLAERYPAKDAVAA